MTNKLDVLAQERVASIRDIQKNPSRALQGITRVMRGTKTVGFYLSNDEMDNLLEDLEAAASRSLRERVKEARMGLKKSELISLNELAANYGV